MNSIMGLPMNEALNLVKLNTTSYPNLKFDNDATQNDFVNKPLLDDINSAAQKADLVATITTAKSGHPSLTINGRPSRHMDGTGVDIAILDGIGSGYATNSKNGIPKFRELGNKLKDALVSMGYTWNVEVGNDKAVLWQTNIGGNHFNHLHISNKSGKSSSVSDDKLTLPSGIDFDINKFKDLSFFKDLLNTILSGSKGSSSNFLQSLKDMVNLKEQSYSNSIGKGQYDSYDSVVVPAKKNSKLYSPVSGKIDNFTYKRGCGNQLTIKHTIESEVYYLMFCGLDRTDLSQGSSVSKGTELGSLTNDVKVTLYNSSGRAVKIGSITAKEKVTTKSEPVNTNQSPLDKFTNRLKKIHNYPNKGVSFGQRVLNRLQSIDDAPKSKSFPNPFNESTEKDQLFGKRLIEDIQKKKRLL